MIRHRFADARILLSVAALSSALCAQGTPVGFEETYALAGDRAKAVATLIQGTEEWYYYSARERLDARDFASVQALLGPWTQRHGRSNRLREIENRLALLDFDSAPQRAFALVRERLGITFNHARQTADESAGLGSTLAAAALDPAALRKQALESAPGTVSGFTDAALPTLLGENLSADQLHDLLSRLRRADVADLPSHVIRDLSHKQSRGFGSLPVHGMMFLAQLEACAQAMPSLLQEPRFVAAMIAKLAPAADRRWQEDPALRRAQLERLQAFAQRLSPSFNSFKAHVLHHLVLDDLQRGTVDRERFLAYLRLPRRAGYVKPEYLRAFQNAELANLGADFPTGLPAVGDDAETVRAALERLFESDERYDDLASFLDADYLKAVLAETKLLLGQGDAERWYSLRNDPAAIERLKQRIEIDFPRTRKTTFAADEAVAIDVDLKNVPTLLVKVFAIDAYRYLTEQQREVDATIELDGVVPNHEFTVTSDLPPIRRQRRTFELPQLAAPGTYVVEFVGNGTSSRAVVHKGGLRHVVRTTAAGQSFRVFDETGAHRKDAVLWFGGREYAAGTNGEVLLPFTTSPGQRKAVLRAEGRASLATFEHVAESYRLEAAMHIDREALIAGQKAAVLLRPRLLCAGERASVALLEEPVLSIQVVDLDRVATVQEVRGLRLTDDAEAVHEFFVPERMQGLSASLRARVKKLDGSTEDLVVDLPAVSVNAIDRGPMRMSPSLVLGERGYELELRGKNGEPRAGKTLQLTLQHRDFNRQIYATLATDARGRVTLGALPGITSIFVQREGEFGGSLQLLRGASTLPNSIHAVVGDPIAVPYSGTLREPTRAAFSLVGATADHFDKLSIRDGSLVVGNLPVGRYELTLHETGQSTVVRVAEGARDGGWIICADTSWQATPTVGLAMREPAIEGDELVIRLRGATAGTRVHVVTTRATPGQTASALAMPGSGAIGFTHAKTESQYAAGRTLGDEYRYVLERRFAQKFPGNMLPRPSLLVNPWRLDEDSRNEAVGLGGGAGGRFGGRAGGRGGVSRDAKGGEGGGAAFDLASFANYDYLPEASRLHANLRVDANGEVRVRVADLGAGNLVHVTAVDGDQTVTTTVPLAEAALTARSRTLPRALASEMAFAEGKRITFVAAGDEAPLGDSRSVQFETFDTLADVHRAWMAIRTDDQLAKFAFVLDWPTLSPERKLALYSEHACHELHFFLHRKDRAFFDTVVAPALRNKREKTFLDRWLLAEDLTPFLEPWDFAQLTLVEQILLAQRLDGAQRDAVARLVRERFELRPLPATALDRLFDVAWQSSALAEPKGGGEGYRGPADKMPSPAEQAPRPGGGRGFLGGLDGGPTAPGAPSGPTTGGPGGPAAAKPAAPPVAAERARRNLQAEKAEMADAEAESAGVPARDALVPELKQQLGEELALRGVTKALYRAVEPTRLLVERNYWQRRNAEPLADVVAPNRFWADFAEAPADRPFASAAVLQANGSFLETMMALAVLDLPFVAGKHEIVGDGEQRKLRAATPLLLVKKEVAPAEKATGEAPLLLGENFFRADDRFRFVDGEQRDNFLTGEFLTDVTYGCQVVVTNPTSAKRVANVLLQVPAGAVPVQGGFWTRGVTVELQPYATAQLEYHFYFPKAGAFAHYPAHAAEKGKIAAAATAREFTVVDVPTAVDTTSWEIVSQQGSGQEVLDFLDRNNLHRLDLDKIAWRMKERGFFDAVLQRLRARHAWSDTLWSYAILHGDAAATREYLEHQPAFLAQLGSHLRSPLVDVDPVVQKRIEQLELDPLVHQRAHQLGARRVLGNADLAAQYQKLMDVLGYKPTLSSEDRLAVTYYLLLQDRIEEGLAQFAQVRRDEVQETLQYDYLSAYLCFFTADTQKAREIAERYKDHPVLHWQKRFATVLAQLDEIDGKAPRATEPGNDSLAATAPSLELRIDGGKLKLDHKNLAGCELRFFPIDVEFAFSSRPFADGDRAGAAYVQPVLVQQATFGKDATSTTIDLPERFARSNVLVEARAAGITRTRSYFANALGVRFLESYGQVAVSEPDTDKPLPKTYVKVFAKLPNGQVRFHKDGYTDLRGRFDYASLSDDPNAGAVAYAVLVLHEQRGAVIREIQPPQR